MADKAARPAGNGKKRLLLVEDEAVISELLRERLTAAGYEVAIAQDGMSGLALIRDMRPDLVLLDMLLPGMNGFQVLEKMKKEGLLPAIPVLIISNSGQPFELERALRLGVRDYLIKVNFDPREVLERVENILGAEASAFAPRVARGSKPGRADSTGAPTILIVEDDFLLAGLLERQLIGAGYPVARALDAAEARRALDSGPVDLILLDMVLPGMDGFAFLDELKNDPRRRQIPVLIISNLGQQEEIERGRKLGAADYIIKANISPKEIGEKVDEILQKNKTQ